MLVYNSRYRRKWYKSYSDTLLKDLRLFIRLKRPGYKLEYERGG